MRRGCRGQGGGPLLVRRAGQGEGEAELARQEEDLGGRLDRGQLGGETVYLNCSCVPALDPATGLLVRGDGTLDPAVHVAGIPVDEVVHDTIISPMPGTNPTMLRETDRVARSAVRIALHAASVSPTVPLARSSA